MIIKLLPTQIPDYQEIIKHTVSKSRDYKGVDLERFINRLFNSLLCETAQCWIMFNNDRVIDGVVITKIEGDKTTATKTLCIECFISFIMTKDLSSREGMQLLIDFASNEKCSSIICNVEGEDSRNVLSLLGFKEVYRVYEYKI